MIKVYIPSSEFMCVLDWSISEEAQLYPCTDFAALALKNSTVLFAASSCHKVLG
jgi:hypothetical protein